MNYNLEFKIKCVEEYKKGNKIGVPEGCKSTYENFMRQVREWYHLYVLHGIEGLNRKRKNVILLPEEKMILISRVYAGETIRYVAETANIGHTALGTWIKLYEKYGIEGLKCNSRGRGPKKLMKTKTPYKKMSPKLKEELLMLRKRNEYLEAEVALLKKAKALDTKH